MRIAVIGGGHGGYAAAADLASKGHEVRLWRRDASKLSALLPSNTISAVDANRRYRAKLALASPCMSKVIAGSEIVIVALPSYAHRNIGLKILRACVAGQLVLFTPGTLALNRICAGGKSKEIPPGLVVAETASLPYGARKRGEDNVAIMFHAKCLPTAVFPVSQQQFALEKLRLVFPSVCLRTEMLDVMLLNPNLVVHPPKLILSIGAIDRFKKWNIHGDKENSTLSKFVDVLDQERLLLRKHLGYKPPDYSVSSWLKMGGEKSIFPHYSLNEAEDLAEVIDLKGHRYLLEDIGEGLAFVASISRRFGLDMPLTHSILTMGGVLASEDFTKAGFTLNALNSQAVNAAELRTELGEALSSMIRP